MHRASLCTKGPGPAGKEEQDKGLGHWETSSGACLGNRSIPWGQGVGAPMKRPLLLPPPSPRRPGPPRLTGLAPAPAPAPWQRQAEAWLSQARPGRLPGQAQDARPASRRAGPPPRPTPRGRRQDWDPLLTPTTPGRGMLLQGARNKRIKSPIHLLLQM